MALKDSLKHFRDFDNYSGSLTKKDYDDNIDTLADSIDSLTDSINILENEKVYVYDDFNKSIYLNGNLLNEEFGIMKFVNSLYNNDHKIGYDEYKDISFLIQTTDDTQTDLISKEPFWALTEANRLTLLKGNLFAIRDDISEKWVADVNIIISVNNNNLNINKNITDIIKDVSAWDFDVVYDSDNEELLFKVKGEADKTIKWLFNFEMKTIRPL